MLRMLFSLLILSALTADASSQKRFVVYFLGSAKPTAVRAHATYLKAIDEFAPTMRAGLAVKYINLPPLDADYHTALRLIAKNRPDMVIAVNGMYALAARQAFPDTPVVFSSYDDPVKYGIVSGMQSRPEPVSGISLADTLDGKRLEILQQAYPAIKRVAVIADRQWAEIMGGEARLKAEADRLGLTASVLLAENSAAVEQLLPNLQSNQYDAWYIPATPVTDHSADILIKQFQKWQKPSMWTSRAEIFQGAPLSYAQETSFVWRSLVGLTARIQAGEYPGNIPVLRPTHFTLTVRVEAQSLVPPPDASIVRRADYVIR